MAEMWIRSYIHKKLSKQEIYASFITGKKSAEYMYIFAHSA